MLLERGFCRNLISSLQCKKMMFEWKKTVILLITTSILFYALISPKLLPNVTIAEKDAVIISVFVVVSSLCLRLISMLETKKLQQEILLQHSQMNVILNNSPFVIYLKDVNGNILLTNDQLPKLLGISKDKLVGKNISQIFQNAKEISEEDKEIFQTKAPVCVSRRVDFIGISRWYRIIKAPIQDDTGKIISIIAIMENIDKEKELEENKATFIATLTHDLKTPTIAQIKAADLLLREFFGKLNPEQKEMISQIKDSCNYMYDLIFTILDTYLYDNGQTKINPEKFNIAELVNEIAGGLSNLLLERKQKIVINNSTGSDFVVADKFQIKRVIVNLLANAINYGYKESVITVNISENNEWVNVNVHNKGDFIPDVRLKEMFQKYKCSSNAKFQKTGTGLGLYLSKQIIDAHSGNVYAKSDPGNNCDFGFKIPKELNSAVLSH